MHADFGEALAVIGGEERSLSGDSAAVRDPGRNDGGVSGGATIFGGVILYDNRRLR